MKKTVFYPTDAPYSLHDMNVIAFEINGDNLTMKTQSGMVRTAPNFAQINGYVEFLDVEWQWCFAHTYEGFYGNIGAFSGKKMYLKDFIDNFQNAGFSIMDTYYNANRVMFTGFLSKGRTFGECTIEIYHNGIVFYEQNDDDREMKEVILSADGNLSLYLVPAEVADNLADICNEFASNYVWHGGKSGKFLKLYEEQYVAFFTEVDFIEYLNTELYPQKKSIKLKTLGSFDDGVPEDYKHLPWYNF